MSTRKSTSSDDRAVVIDEALCFIMNQHNVLKTPDLSKIVVEHFDPKEIYSAKCKLFGYVPSARPVKRHKPEDNVEDIISLLDNKLLIDDCSLPVFAAADLSKIPSVAPMHIDTLQVLGCMRKLQGELNSHRDCAASIRSELCSWKEDLKQIAAPTDSLELQQELRDLKKAVKSLQFTHEITYAETAKAERVISSMPRNVRTASESDVDERRKTSAKSTNRAPAKAAQNFTKVAATPGTSNQATSVHKQLQGADYQVADAVSKPNTDWQTVGPRKKVSCSIGSRSGCRLKCVSPPTRRTDLFISRLHPKTTIVDVNDFIKDALSCEADIIKLNTKFDSYASFKVSLIQDAIRGKDVFSPLLWPEGCLVRKFFAKRTDSTK